MDEYKLLAEYTIGSREIFKGQLLHVFRDEVRLPDGGTSGREWIKHPGACAVVPVFNSGEVMMLRQYRYPPKQIFWEIPAGKIDAGENPDATARRELREEAGVECQNLVYVGHFYPCVGYSDEIIHMYAAWDIEEIEQKTDPDEFVLKEKLPFSKAVEMAHTGEINDGKTVICLLRIWEWWQKNGPFKI